MRNYRHRSGLTHFAHRPGPGRPVGMRIPGGTDAYALRSSEEMTREMMRRLREAGEIVASACRIAASFSRRIPASLHVFSKDGVVYILGGGEEAPNAYPFDPPRNPPVYHPVYAKGPRDKWEWVPQPYRPFLEEGAEASADKAADAFARVIDDWAKHIGRDRP